MRLSGEVDAAHWVPIRKALEQVHPEGSISHALVSAYLERRKKNKIGLEY